MAFSRSASASLIAALLLSTTLVVGGCRSKDEGPSAAKSSPAKALGLTGPSDEAFAEHFKVPQRKVSEAEAQKALALLNLNEGSSGTLSWDKTSGADGNYSYSGLKMKNDTSSLNIQSATLVGVHMVGDVASFDRADFSGITMIDTGEKSSFTMDSLSVARPSPAMALSIFESLGDIKNANDFNLDIDDDGNPSFGAIGMSGIQMKADKFDMAAKTLIWGVDETTQLADLKVEGINFNGVDRNGGSFKGKLGNITGTGFDSGHAYDNFSKGMQVSGGSPMGALGGFNPFEKAYDSFVLNDFSFDNDVVAVSLKGIEGQATEKGGVTTTRQVSEPMIIKLKNEPKDPSAKQMFDMVKTLGFDELVFQSSGTTILDTNKDSIELKDNLLTLKDGFKLSYNYGATGMKAMTDKMEALGKSGSNQNVMSSLDTMTLNGFQFRLEDDSILERSLKLAAQMRGGTADSIKRELKVGLTLAPMMAGGGIEGDMMGEIANAFGDFVENGGTLSIVMDPKTPIAISDLASAKTSGLTFKDLGFSAKAE